MDALLKLFGDIPLGTAILWIAAVIFVYKVYRDSKKLIISQYVSDQEKETKLEKVLEEVSKYSTLKNEIIKSQNETKKEIRDLRNEQQALKEKVELIDKERREREVNRIREILLNQYRFFTGGDSNPMKAWSQMEKEAFESLFADYEALNGNGYMHTTVQPAMCELDIIPMTELEKLSKLALSRTRERRNCKNE